MGNLNLRAGRPSDAKKAARLADLGGKTPMVRINFDIDREKAVQLKVLAAQSGKTVAEICRGLLDNLLSTHMSK
jgi:hypothetical protein